MRRVRRKSLGVSEVAFLGTLLMLLVFLFFVVWPL